MLNFQLSGINRICSATFVFCTLVLSTNAQGLDIPQNEEGQHLLGLILQDDADKVERYLSSKSIPQHSNISLFKTAILRGNKRIVEAFFKAGANTDEPGLICAALPNVSITELLLTHGVTMHEKECNGMSALQAAVKGGYKDTVQFLLKSGATDQSSGIPTSSASLREAAMAGNTSIMKILLERGDVLDSNTISEVTQRNCMGGNLDVLQLLKDKGITPDYEICYWSLAMIEKSYPDLLAWVKAQNKITKFVFGGQPLINSAAKRGNLLMAKFLIDSGARLDQRSFQDNYSALGAALSPEDVSRPLRLEMAELLLNNGANPNLPEGMQGRTLLEELTRTIGCPSDEKSYRYVWEPRAKAIGMLIRYGADVNLVNHENGNTPLHYAATSGNPDLVQLMLKHGAEVNAVNRDGYTPLYYLAAGGTRCRDVERIEKTVEMMVAHGAAIGLEVKGKKLADLVDRRYPGGDALYKAIARLSVEQRKANVVNQVH